MKICILGHDHEPMLGSVLPHGFIGGFAQADVADVSGFRILRLKRGDETKR